MDISHAALASINTGFKTAFNERFTGVPKTYGMIAMTVKSTNGTEAYPKLSELGPMREWVGERYVERLNKDGFAIRNRKWEKTYAVSVDEIEDDSYGVYTPLMADLGQVTAELPDDLVWSKLEEGFDTTHYDGQMFFDTDHPVEDENGNEQSVSNFQGGTGAAWYLVDDSRVVKPMIFQDRKAATLTAKTNLTDDNVFDRDEFVWGTKIRCAAGFGAWQLIYASRLELNEENYEAAVAAMKAMTGHRGRKLNLKPKKLIVSAVNEGVGRKILISENNAAGATNVWRGSAELHVEGRLTL
ncbi:Mu-like prophage major head subunit gpT family protein [Celeribacter baekdonensis]|uniref:Mu-like prophage major head subunit gpT family protein n=1 Tax=Celeribacter baekdonensis TaxID=875171 RepID=UPI0030D78D03|tara:strand:- start:14866 stop:15762 length:897 start_codon:yes stop_codon:yes gene_type:complete